MIGGVDPQYLRVRPMYIDQCPVPTTTGSYMATDALTYHEELWSSNITTIAAPIMVDDDLTTAMTTTAAPTPQ